ncbi:MAG: hypothetical protein HQK50_07695 [Oligoflexia bacterium]|nr:hypothetical protein [Oligoflexia bacterium]MBF0365439.1 hypothetical protein [Oligoflexia bacterium]
MNLAMIIILITMTMTIATTTTAIFPISTLLANEGDAVNRTLFMEKEWMPFIQKLNAIKEKMRLRAQKGYLLHDRLISQRKLLQLEKENIKLKEKLLGVGNGDANAVYNMLVSCQEENGVSAYSYAAIKATAPTSSNEKIDFYNATKKQEWVQKHNQTTISPYEHSGGLTYKVGESWIDDSVRPHILKPEHTHQIRALIGGQKWLTTLISRMQKVWLNKHSPQELANKSDHELSLPLRLLKKQGGHLLENFGEFAQTFKEEWWHLVQSSTKSHLTPAPAPAGAELDVEALLYYLNHFPGRFFSDVTLDKFCKEHHDKVNVKEITNNSKDHERKKVHAAIIRYLIAAGDAKAINRSHMEDLSIKRFIVLPWKRTVPLEDASLKIRRLPGEQEYSRIRNSPYPYFEQHGLSIGSGGTLEGDEYYGNTLFELSIPVDSTAKLENWYVIDLEKITQESYLLNPKAATKTTMAHATSPLLPGEHFLMVGQNSRASSSIGATAHTQIGAATIKEFPLLAEKNNPIPIPELAGTLDLVTLKGITTQAVADNFFLKLHVQNPNSLQVKHFLFALKHHLLTQYHNRNIDFEMITIPDGEGGFVIKFMPLADVSLLDPTQAPARWVNKLSGKEWPYPEYAPTSSVQTARGTLEALATEEMQKKFSGGGKEIDLYLELYNFLALPNSRAIVSKFIENYNFAQQATVN